MQSCKIPTAQTFHLHDYRFSDFVLDDDDTIKACIRMFLDLELLERFHINYEVRPFVSDDNIRMILLKSTKYESFIILFKAYWRKWFYVVNIVCRYTVCRRLPTKLAEGSHDRHAT